MLLKNTRTAAEKNVNLKNLVAKALELAANLNGIYPESVNAVWNNYGKKAEGVTNTNSLKAIVKKCVDDLEALKRIADAPAVTSFNLYINYSKCYEGMQAKATYTDNTGAYFVGGRTSGGGYDKESTAASDVLNNYAIQKLLLDHYQKNANGRGIGYINGRDVFGYGVYINEYSGKPQFFGGVGMESFIHVLENIGFKYRADYSGKHDNRYYFYKEA